MAALPNVRNYCTVPGGWEIRVANSSNVIQIPTRGCNFVCRASAVRIQPTARSKLQIQPTVLVPEIMRLIQLSTRQHGLNDNRSRTHLTCLAVTKHEVGIDDMPAVCNRLRGVTGDAIMAMKRRCRTFPCVAVPTHLLVVSFPWPSVVRPRL